MIELLYIEFNPSLLSTQKYLRIFLYKPHPTEVDIVSNPHAQYYTVYMLCSLLNMYLHISLVPRSATFQLHEGKLQGLVSKVTCAGQRVET